MNRLKRTSMLAMVGGFFLLLVLVACQPLPNTQAQAQAPAQATAPALATAKAVSTLSNQPGRAIVTARDNHFVVDSVPPLGGPNEELNPLDLILGALATCGTFVYEAAAKERNIPLTEIAATVEADFDPRGVKGEPVNPRIQALRVHMDLSGADEEQAAKLAEQFQARCPIYTTLSRAAPIEITSGEKGEADVAEGLATAKVVSRLSNQPGRAIVTARGNHFVVDSVPPLQGPNQERNPLDLILGALATCGTFVYETAAQEQGIPVTAISASVEGDFDPRGVKGEPVDPHIQALRVTMTVEGATATQAAALNEQFQARCPIYTTLSRAAPIQVENVIQ
jgi:uncharacterized OsmC-like protein